MNKLFFEMRIVDDTGRTHGVIRRQIDERAAFMGDRFPSLMRAGLPQLAGNFDDCIRVLTVKEFRRGLLIEAARLCGMGLADHLEDKEGWHGADRQETAEASQRAPSPNLARPKSRGSNA